MTKQRTGPMGPRKRKPQVIIAVVVLLIVAACLAAVAVYANQIGSAGSKSAADSAALVNASPSATETETESGWTTSGGGGSKPSAAKKAKGDRRPSSTATSAGHSGTSSASGGGSSSYGTSSRAASSGSSATGNKSGGKSGGSSSKPTRPPKPAALTCTLSIDAETAGLGTFMPTRKVTFKKGETVFDVLKRECRAAGIPMEFEYTPMYKSAYIEGINGLYEFDRGELSGWMYSVNGWFPNYGCSRYKLKAGDRIQWRYTCDLGKDIGGDYSTQGR